MYEHVETQCSVWHMMLVVSSCAVGFCREQSVNQVVSVSSLWAGSTSTRQWQPDVTVDSHKLWHSQPSWYFTCCRLWKWSHILLVSSFWCASMVVSCD